MGANLKIMAASQAVYFFWYNKLKAGFEQRSGHSVGVLENLLLAYSAGAINACMTCPLWAAAMRLKLATKKRAALEERRAAVDGDGAGDAEAASTAAADAGDATEEPGIVSVLKQMLEDDGVAGLYKGLGPALVLCTNPAIQFLVYEQLRRRLAASRPVRCAAPPVVLHAPCRPLCCAAPPVVLRRAARCAAPRRPLCRAARGARVVNGCARSRSFPYAALVPLHGARCV